MKMITLEMILNNHKNINSALEIYLLFYMIYNTNLYFFIFAIIVNNNNFYLFLINILNNILDDHEIRCFFNNC